MSYGRGIDFRTGGELTYHFIPSYIFCLGYNGTKKHPGRETTGATSYPLYCVNLSPACHCDNWTQYMVHAVLYSGTHNIRHSIHYDDHLYIRNLLCKKPGTCMVWFTLNIRSEIGDFTCFKAVETLK